jgi:hypothetical protein
MKRLAPVCFLLASSAIGQQSSGPATAKGSCSPASTGNSNTFTITCGIGKEQGDELLKIVNKILANQKDLKDLEGKLDEILKGVNDIRKSSATRRLSDQQKTLLLGAMRPFKGEKVTITTVQGDPEAYRYAEDFAAVFRAAEFEFVVFAGGAERTGVNEFMSMGGGPPVTGVALHPKDEAAWRKPVVQAFAGALVAAQIKHSTEYIGRLQVKDTDLEIHVGPKPID